MQLHIKCLSEFFKVIVINHDCDYDQICDTHQPDLALFESGYRTYISRKIEIKNTSAFPEIPKIGLHNGDSWCDCRSGFISDMALWGIEIFFSISTTMAEYTPAMSEHLFVWPNFIDSDIHRDYRQSKVIPVLLNGNSNPLYPWRQKIYSKVSGCFPSLIFPHLGYGSNSPLMFHGEQYARTINSSWVVPTCGTIAKEVVRKHLEIPGCKACLVTEKTPALEAAGFVDMVNCVFANEKDVLDKLNFLFQNPDELETIIDQGYQLAHTRHTLKQRNQIFDWFNLHKNLKSHERIVQRNPFESLQIVEKSSGIKNEPIKCDGIVLKLLRKGDEKLSAGKYEDAKLLYLQCLDYISWMSEPKLKLAICNLYKGDAFSALNWIIQPIQQSLTFYKAKDPDPVEWAYYIITLICQGKLDDALIQAYQFPLLNHPELDRVRWVINNLQDKEASSVSTNNNLHPRMSIHRLPQISMKDWINNLCLMLNACQKWNYVEILNNRIQRKNKSLLKKYGLLIRIYGTNKINTIFKVLTVPNLTTGLPSIHLIDYLIRLAKWIKIGQLKRSVLKYLR